MNHATVHAVPITRAGIDGPSAHPAPFRVLNGAVYFSGECEACRPFCAAVCCRGYGFVSLSEEEARSGRYLYKEADDTCSCELCTRMRAAGVRHTLRKRPDGACVYLDGAAACSIYDQRPETCRSYTCVNVPFGFTP